MRQVVLDEMDELGLKHMRQALERQLESPTHTDRSFEERLLELVQYERVERDDRRMKERIRKAGFSLTARLEELDSWAARGIERGTLEFLGQDPWVKEHRNVAVTGATGVGKTFVASALAHRACQFGFNARYFRLPRLLQDMEIARVDVLVLDDWGLAPLEPAARRDLLEILDDRYQKKSTVISP